jgi:hypothetical protein
MPDDVDKLTPADSKDLAAAIAFSLRFEGRKRVHQADEYMAAMAAPRIVVIWSARASSLSNGGRSAAALRLGADSSPDSWRVSSSG